MLKHIVIWPIKEETTAEQKAEIKVRLEGLTEIIPELKVMEIGMDDAAGTMSLYSEFDSNEGLVIYQAHPAHQEVVGFVKPLVAGREVCDYES